MLSEMKEWKDILYRYFSGPLYFVTPIIYFIFIGFIFYTSLGIAYIKSDGVWFVALAAAFSVVALVRYFMGYFSYIVYREGGYSKIGKVGFILFLVLFLFSGYSLIASFVIMEEGPEAIAKTSADAAKSFRQLSDASDDIMYGGEYGAFLHRVEGGRASLIEEIYQRALIKAGQTKVRRDCGIAGGAEGVIKTLSEDLPGLAVNSATKHEHDCKNTKELAAIEAYYNNEINKRKSDVERDRFKLPERRLQYGKIGGAVIDHAARLDALQMQAQTLGSPFDLPLLLKSERTLTAGEQEYGALLDGLLKLSLHPPKGIPTKIDVSPATQVLDWLGILPLVFKRLGPNVETLTVVFAVIWDLAMLRLVSFYGFRWLERRERFVVQSQIDNIEGTGVGYLLRPRT